MSCVYISQNQMMYARPFLFSLFSTPFSEGVFVYLYIYVVNASWICIKYHTKPSKSNDYLQLILRWVLAGTSVIDKSMICLINKTLLGIVFSNFYEFILSKI
ncbi:GSCOCG00006486001-RA-CDS [Cotesia congregata]|nr:GSCOCG00006486001-RA-CDS [Cotesia congregata]